ncbi:HAD family hydrolase [candidate division KSB1 bacterium]|nr:HAD family hydrolase [candidate division KSB1 bacterium]
MIQAVIFDLFGTLINSFSKAGYHENLVQMARILQLDPPAFCARWYELYEERVLGIYQSPTGVIEKICEQLRHIPPPTKIGPASQLRYNFVREALVPRPDTVPTLHYLRRRGLKLALLSDCSSEIPELWPETAFATIFDVTVFSGVVRLKKPMPEIYALTTLQLGVQAMDCIFVGDGGSNELTGAAQAGMHPVRIRVPQAATSDALQIEPDPWPGLVIPALHQVIPFVESFLR